MGDWAFAMREVILTCPLKLRPLVDGALADCQADDVPALRSWLNAGLVVGDWRRAAIHKRIEELQEVGKCNP